MILSENYSAQDQKCTLPILHYLKVLIVIRTYFYKKNIYSYCGKGRLLLKESPGILTQ